MTDGRRSPGETNRETRLEVVLDASSLCHPHPSSGGSLGGTGRPLRWNPAQERALS
jgi:hypothetical protein